MPDTGTRIFELEDAPSGDGLATLYLAVDHPNFATPRRVLVAGLPTGGEGGAALPSGIVLNDGTVPFVVAQTGVQGSTPGHLAVRAEVTVVAAQAATALSAATDAQADADAAAALAASAVGLATTAQATANAALPKAGGTVTGVVVFDVPPTVPTATVGSQAVSKGQMDTAIAAVGGGAAPSDAAPQAPGTAAAGTAAEYARGDHVHPAQSVPAASNATPAALGSAASGASASYSRADHVHPTQDVSGLMPKTGGTFTGQIVVLDPAGATNPATKAQLDTVLATANSALAAAGTADGKAVTAQTTATSAGTAAATADGKAVAAQATADAAMPKAGGTFTGQIAAALVPLTDGATINTDCAGGNVFTVTLGGNHTLANPTNVVAGATYCWLITQGTSPWTLALGSNFKLGRNDAGTALAYVPSTTAGETDLLSAIAITTTRLIVSIVKGYA